MTSAGMGSNPAGEKSISPFTGEEGPRVRKKYSEQKVNKKQAHPFQVLKNVFHLSLHLLVYCDTS